MVLEEESNYRPLNSSPLVDIVIPYYNEFEYLRESVSSVLSQTLTNFRLIIIDDGTRDERASKYIEGLKDPRIEYIKNPINIGLARNFEQSRVKILSKYGVILGQDDILLPNYLEEMTLAGTNFPKAGIIQPLVQVINDKGDVVRTTVDTVKTLIRNSTRVLAKGFRPYGSTDAVFISPPMASKALMVGDFLYFPTLMWRTSYLSRHNFREDLEITLDIELIINLFQAGAGLLLVKKPLAQYRRHAASKSGIPEEKLQRLSEEVSLYSELAQTLSGDKLLKILAYLRPSTRLYALVELLKAIVRLDFSRAINFLILGLK